jgi:hypothetical protein
MTGTTGRTTGGVPGDSPEAAAALDMLLTQKAAPGGYVRAA